jgi:hypothetical protein
MRKAGRLGTYESMFPNKEKNRKEGYPEKGTHADGKKKDIGPALLLTTLFLIFPI